MKRLPTRLLPLLIALSAIATDLPDLGDSSSAQLPAHEERRIADSVVRELRRSGEMQDDVEITDYLERLGYKLASNSNDSRVNFRFFPMASSQINAWAIPGGVIGINLGLVVLSQHESELAAVMAHEIAHVTQHHYARMLESQKGSGLMTLGTMAVAILAASKSHDSNAPMAAVAAGEGYQLQRYLDFSRDFEREADRIGMQTLQTSGFDPRAMPTFFDRMQRFYRNVDNGAFAFLRTHPVTNERISDSEARANQLPYKQWIDSMDYLFVREKARVAQLGAREAIDYYAASSEKKKYANEAAQTYGYAVALQQVGRHEQAWEKLALARKALGTDHAMLASLAGLIRLEQKRYAEASELYSSGRSHFPGAPALVYGQIDVALRQAKLSEAIQLTEAALAEHPSDANLHKRLADAYTQRGESRSAHRAMAEYYALNDQPQAAVQQLLIAQKAGGDFYQLSAIEARLRELKAQLAEERKLGRRPEEPEQR